MAPLVSSKGSAPFGLNVLSVLAHLTLFAITLAIAAHIFDAWAGGGLTSIFSNPAASAFILFTLLACSVGLATMLVAAVHLMFWNEAGRFNNFGTNMITLALTTLAAGFGIKTIQQNILRDNSGQYVRELKTIAAFMIILWPCMMLHCLLNSAFRNPSETGTMARQAGTTAAGHKNYAAGQEERALAA